MTGFSPFIALRYNTSRFTPEEVTSPPYDVLSAKDREDLVARSEFNAVIVDLPLESDGEGRYAQAGKTLDAWLNDGVLVADDTPQLTAYRMTTLDDLGKTVATLGVIGALELSRPGEGQILPHEHTTPKAKSDRLDLLRGTATNLSAIWGLSLTHGLSDLIDVSRDPDQAWRDEEDTLHEVWRISDSSQIEAICAAIGQTPIVVADGHHRYETSLAYRDEQRESAQGDTPGAEATLCYVVELSEEQLTVRPIHRLVSGVEVDDLGAALGALDGSTVVGKVSAEDVASGDVLREMDDKAAIAVVGPDGSAVLVHLDPQAYSGVDDLDSARLVAALEAIGPYELTYQHGTALAQKAVTDGTSPWAVLIRPVTVAAIEANAHTGDRMPPKSTFFFPKPRTGIVFRPLS
ncbi:MAG: DUF1015 domain-containing protein [Acidimicrobiales bacterium]|nr:DUF1015 domain-containing protein [Acidimicrobiales bacterium]